MKNSNIDMSLKADRRGVTDGGRSIEPGDTVEYVAHVGWNIRVRFSDGTTDIAPAAIFPTMREERRGVRHRMQRRTCLRRT